MVSRKLKDFLEAREIPYKSMDHPRTFTAQQTAQVTHIRGKRMAKTVIVRVDGLLSMVVVPADAHVDLEHILELTDADRVELADEMEFAARFPDCEVGAMPPFGNLYGMDVFVHEDLAREKELAFSAGAHNEVILMAFEDFARLVKPNVGTYAL